MLLDFTSDFDTLNHNILSIRLNEISIHGQVHIWCMYLLSSRTSSVKINYSLSPPCVIHSVPQGSVFGHILFIIYILPIKPIVHKYYNIHYHLYANDIHILTSLPNVSDYYMIQSIYLIVLLISLNGSLITLFP